MTMGELAMQVKHNDTLRKNGKCFHRVQKNAR